MITSEHEEHLAEELENFQEIAQALKPSSGGVPQLKGIDICGMSMPFNGVIGGDHLIYLDFKKRYDLARRMRVAEEKGRPQVVNNLNRLHHRAGILLADVPGHRVTDALIAAMLHQAFLLGVYYELDRFGEITIKLFEHINQRFYRTTNINKFLTMLYGEISDEGKFRFITAGHQQPMVFSREYASFVHISEDRMVTYPPVGIFPSNADPNEMVEPGQLGFKPRYTVNEIDLLNAGDVLLLYTDGLSEHAGGDYFPTEVERCIAEVVDQPAGEICECLRRNFLAFADPQDDVTFVVIKKTASLHSASC